MKPLTMAKRLTILAGDAVWIFMFSWYGFHTDFTYRGYNRFTLAYVSFTLLLMANIAEFRFFASIFDEAYMNKKDKSRTLHTRIRGIWYDLAAFNHPGGPIALHLCEGRDGTALFESHHYLIPSKRLYAILNKYKVRKAERSLSLPFLALTNHKLALLFFSQVDDELQKTIKTIDARDDGAHYVWENYENDVFTMDVKKMVVDHFTPIAKARGISLRQATKATPQRWLMIFSMMAAFVCTLPAFLR